MSAPSESVIPADIREQVEGIFDGYGFDQGLLFGAVCAAIASSQEEIARLRKALEDASLGLDDLMRTLYAPELYRPEHVAESHDRIGRAGAPLAYVAGIQERAARALSGERDNG